MLKLGSVLGVGLALVVLAGCERSSAVASRDHADGSSARQSAYQDGGAGAGAEPSANDSGDRSARRDDGPVRQIDGKAIWSSSRKGSAEENAQRSFDRNGEAFGARDLDSFIKKAHAFVEHPPVGTQQLKRTNGDVLFYDGKDNIFAVANKAGVPRAMFKPDQGGAYWDIQKAREAKRQTAKADRKESGSDG